jgi:hypothetical protein
MFAALSLGVNLSAPTTWGRNLSTRTIFVVAVLAWFALAAVAAAAGLAWAQVFLTSWPAGWMRRLEACGILVGISAQPIFAGIVAWGSKP